MALATQAGDKVKAMRNDLNALVVLESPSSEELEKAIKLNDDISAAEVEYSKLKAVDDANDARKAADEVEKVKSRQPVNRPSLAMVQAVDERSDFEREMAALVPSKKSWFEAFANSPTYRQIHELGHFSSMGMGYKIACDDMVAFKAAGDPIMSTQFGTRMTDTNILPHAFPPANILSLIPVVNVTAGNVRYYQATQPMGLGPAAFIPEGTAKPEVQPRWVAVDAPMETIADYTAVTLQALDDLPQLRGVVDTDLRNGVEVALDNALINGTGTTPQIRGIVNFAGVLAPAFVASTSIPDSIAKGIQAIVAGGYGRPNAIVLNPADWWTTRTLKAATTGVYYWGPPTDQGIPSIWGIPVVTDANLAAGLAIVGDFNYATFYQRMGITFVVGLKNDDLIKNQITIVCEMRGALALRRPQAFAKVALL
jgi:hypothetical protein